MIDAAVADIARASSDRFELWTRFLNEIGARRVAEVGVYRGAYAERILDACPAIETYYMIDPWRHLDDWNKPANRKDDTFQKFYEETMDKTSAHEHKRVVLRGRTTEVIDQIPDGSLDFVYIDGDHTLRGISIDLVAVQPKLREGGWIGGDDFTRTIWQHGADFEPTLVFPFAVYFAEATGSRIYGLPRKQFLIERQAESFEFVDLTGKYDKLDLQSQLSSRPAEKAAPERRTSHRWSKLLNRGAKSPLSRQFTRLHAELYRRSRGRLLTRWFGGPVMVLEVVGRRSGQVRRVPVIRVQHGDSFIVVPSNAGSDRTPAWWLNLRDAGEGWVVYRGQRTRVRPRVTEGAERKRMWARFVEVYPGLDDYATFTEREWPVVLLEPVE